MKLNNKKMPGVFIEDNIQKERADRPLVYLHINNVRALTRKP